MNNRKPKCAAVIPARYQSTRLPRKLLLPLGDRSLLEATYQQVCKCHLLDAVFVTTDHLKIVEDVKRFGGKVYLTPESCPSGTDRIGQVLDHLQSFEIIVNIQGDEPFIEPEVIDEVIEKLINTKEASIATAAKSIETEEEFYDRSVVKCVTDLNDRALYFSRAPIPLNKEGVFKGALHHLGIYAYRRSYLEQILDLLPTPLQKTEDLEQLKALEHGYTIVVAKVKSRAFGIDTEEDYQKALGRVYE